LLGTCESKAVERGADLIAACKARDQVLLWNFYCSRRPPWVSYASYDGDCFSHADPLPQYGMSGFPSLWWWDAEKAAKDRQTRLSGKF
jgi:microcin C transport system substrate-binding protein